VTSVSDKWHKRLKRWQEFSQDKDFMDRLRDSRQRNGRHPDVNRACAAFGLDPSNAVDRELLLDILADIVFHKAATDLEFKLAKVISRLTAAAHSA
jgi:hypothetical protein